MPPHDRLDLRAEVVARVPATEGVYRLFSPTDEVLQISGVPDLRAALRAVLGGPLEGEAAAFVYEAEPLYTQRESELLALYVQAHGRLPVGNDILATLTNDDDGDGPH